MEIKKNIRIEEVGDISSDYPYLEVFLKDKTTPVLEISISKNRELIFKYYASSFDLSFGLEEWEYILSTAKDFLPKAIKNEDDFLNSQ